MNTQRSPRSLPALTPVIYYLLPSTVTENLLSFSFYVLLRVFFYDYYFVSDLGGQKCQQTHDFCVYRQTNAPQRANCEKELRDNTVKFN